MTFLPGNTLGAAGRPKGIKDRRLRHRQLFEENSETLIKTAITLANQGDARMLATCIDRITPKAKYSADDYLWDFDADLNKVKTQEDLDKYTDELMSHVQNGQLPLPQAESLLNMCKIKLEMSLKIKQDAIIEQLGQRMDRADAKLGFDNNTN